MSKEEDLRKVRTKRKLITALFELLKKKELQEIKIIDLTGKAKLSRQTFYRHYELIEDLYRDCVEDLFGQMFSEIIDAFSKEPTQDIETNLLVAFRVFYNHRDKMSILLSVSDRDLIIDNLHRQYELVYERDGILNYIPPDTSHFQYLYIRYESGGLYVLLKEWLNKKEPISPEKITKIYLKIREIPFL